MAVASAGPYAINVHLALLSDNHTNTSSLNFYNADALPDAQPTVSKHWWHSKQVNRKYQTPPPVWCCPWWVSLSISCSGKLCCHLLSHFEYTPFSHRLFLAVTRKSVVIHKTESIKRMTTPPEENPAMALGTHAHTHTHPIYGPLSRTTRYQKGKTNLD